MARQPAFAREVSTLRRVLADPAHQIWWSRHANEKMAERGIVQADVTRVLKTGTVTFVETKRDELWHIEGKDLDGRSIRVIATVMEAEITIKVVTAIDLKRR